MNGHLQQFAHQLAAWTETIIEHGRTPFRRVDTYPEIDTAEGIKSPPLIFWINRQSMMAGGVLLLPDNNLDAELQVGRSCATALGLCHFITWEAKCVRIWKVEANETVEQQNFPLTNPDQPETFRLLLAEVLETLKLLAILGAIPAKDLAPHYFNNLFLITLEQALPPLTEAHRSQRSETDEVPAEDTDFSANEANRLILLKLIALIWSNKCPGSILPEKIEQTIELSLPDLPESLRQALNLKATPNTPPLPLESAVFFHHLLLRLRQLAWIQDPEKAKESIRCLAAHWFQGKTREEETAAVYLYPDVPVLNSTANTLLSSSPSLLAISALLTEINDLPPKRMICGNLFDLHRDNLPQQQVYARLLNQHIITNFDRRKYTTALRSAWPNRHLKIKAGQPFWPWELIHLLGVCHSRQQLVLEVPDALLNNPRNELAWILLCENYSFQQIQLLNNNCLKLDIYRDKSTLDVVSLKINGEAREIHFVEDPIRFKRQLLIALNLPSTVYNLLGNELIWPDSDKVSNNQQPGEDLYRQSRLYKWMYALLSGTSIEDKNGSQTLDSSLPYPEPLLLKELARFDKRNPAAEKPASLDSFLANILACPTIETIDRPKVSKAPRTFIPEDHSKNNIQETIAQQLSVHGIPNFPAQYLYFLDQPVICHYTIHPPLVVKSSLLGGFELQDADGQIISGYGDELKQILLLCAEAGKTEIDLPDGRQQLEQLLQHYLKDLETLYVYLNNLCYSQIKDFKSARKCIKSVWGQLNLPDPSWFRNP
ncbi:hypothetical protein SAMN05660420_00682 [Desulfuromusa kysingii]|uniref:Uncharacterized protein n=1 Tax=Desulfuromusa kysingii TaxID=37625 RepID=A0A1H3WWK0_9BACT|nr:hypothetical protein [Desulfuromusa kysingii]SDZ90754.1 hypothetical protein SAMN05660420_00682 [Desulfuromusa kysingii]